MAASKPVIASRTGGLTEIVRDGVDGILVAPDDLAGLCQALDQILADPARAKAMGKAGRTRVAETYSEDHFYDRLITIYDEVIHEGTLT